MVKAVKTTQQKLLLLWATGISSFLIATSVSLADGVAHNDIIGLNNEGVRALNNNDWQTAIAKFTEALHRDPTYQLPRDNMVIARNNYGLTLIGTPGKALEQFHLAFLLNMRNHNSSDNMASMIRKMGKDPDDYKVREDMADAAMDSGDYPGAAAEYAEALRLHESDSLKLKFEQAYARLEKIYRIDSSFIKDFVSKPVTVRQEPAHAAQNLMTLETYVTDVQRAIKKTWRPPKVEKPREIVVTFQIELFGTINNVRVITSSGDAKCDEAAALAVRHASPFPPLPEGAPVPLTMRFSFFSKVPVGEIAKPAGYATQYAYRPHQIAEKEIDSLKLGTQLQIVSAEEYARAFEATADYGAARRLYERILAAKQGTPWSKETEEDIERVKFSEAALGALKKSDFVPASENYALALQNLSGRSYMDVQTKLGLVDRLRCDIDKKGIKAEVQKQARDLSEKYQIVVEELVRAEALNKDGFRREKLQRYSDAESKYREALAIKTKVLGETDPETLDEYADIARVRNAQSESADAQALYQKALASYRKVPNRGEKFVQMLESYADLLAHAHHPKKADAVYAEIREFYKGK